MSAHLAFRRYRIPLIALWCPVLLGGVLSASIEMTQLFVPGRNCSTLDLLDNVIGSALGVAAGVAFEGIAPSVIGALAFVSRRPADRSARALVFIWIASLLFPLFPVTSLYVWRAKSAMFLDAAWLEPVAMTSAALSWFAAGRLLNAAGFPRVQESLVALILLLPAQILILTLQPTPAVIIGAAIGAAAFCFWGESRAIKRPLGWIFLGLLLARGLVPFHLLAQPQNFIWIPFGASLTSTWQSGIQVLIGKAFYYGTAIWLLRTGGMRMRNATIVVALVLAAIEAAQRYLPDRTPEVTDPIMAILLGLGLWAMAHPQRAKLKMFDPVRPGLRE
jgi:VanZ family protein